MRYQLWIILILTLGLPEAVLPFDAARVASPDTFLFVSLSDAAFIQTIRDSGYYLQFYDAENIFRFPGGIHENIKNWAQDFPITYDEWAPIFPGAQCCFLTDLKFRSGTTPVFDLALILEHNGDLAQVTGFIEKLLSRLSSDAKHRYYIHNGVKVFTQDHYIRKTGKILTPTPTENQKPDPIPSSDPFPAGEVFREFSYHFQYAFVDRYLFFCEGKGEPIKALIDRYKSPGSLTLSGTKTYKILFKDIPNDRYLRIYFNLEDIFTKLGDLYKREKKIDLSPLSLMEIKALGIVQYITPHALQSRIRLYAPSPRTGVSEVVFQFRKNSFSTLRFIPPDTVAFTSISLDLQRVYRSLLAAFGILYPEEAGSLRKTIQANNLLLGVDLENQILGQMKGEMGYYLRKSTDSSGRDGIAEVYFVEAENPDFFREALKKLFVFAKNNLALEMQEKRHLDTTYWTPAPIGANIKQEDFIPPFGIFIYDKYLFVSQDIPELHSLIARLKSKNSDGFSREGLKAFMSRHPNNDCVGIRIIDQQVSASILKGFHPLPQRIDREKPAQSLLNSQEKGAYGGSLKTLIYQNQDVFSILSEMSFFEVEENKTDP